MSTTDPVETRATRMRKRRDSLTPRAVRVRNALLLHAAARLGLSGPTPDDLRALPDHMTLRQAVRWWQAQTPGAAPPAPALRRRPHLALRMACITAITVLGLALSFGRAQ